MKENTLIVILLLAVVIFAAGCVSKEGEKNEINISDSSLQNNPIPIPTIQQIEPQIVEAATPTFTEEKKETAETKNSITTFLDADYINASWSLNELYEAMNSHCYMIFVQTKDIKSLQPIRYRYAATITYSSRDASEGYTNYFYAEYSNFSFVKYKDNAILYADLASSTYHGRRVLIKIFDKLPQPPVTAEKPFGNASLLGYGYGKFPAIEPGIKSTVAFAEFSKMPSKESILRIEMDCNDVFQK